MLMGPTNVVAKSSLLLLYHRIFAPKQSFRYLIYFGIVFAIGTQLSMNIIDAIFCTPNIGQPWSYKVGIKCASHARGYTIAQGISNVLLDLFILCLPIPTVWGLQLPVRKKIGVTLIFMTGLL